MNIENAKAAAGILETIRHRENQLFLLEKTKVFPKIVFDGENGSEVAHKLAIEELELITLLRDTAFNYLTNDLEGLNKALEEL